MVTKQEFEQSNKAQNERMTVLENELINVNTSLESFDTQFTSLETMMQQVLKNVGLDEHASFVEQNRPPGPRRLQSEDHAHGFDGSDNEVRNPYRPTRAYPRQPERDEIPRDFRGQQMANSRYNFEQPRAQDDMGDLTKRVKIEAPEFDGRIDHNVFLDWIDALEDYFDWYHMSEGQKVRFAKLRAPQGIKSFKPGSNPSSHTSCSSQIECFNCHAKGHIASHCPTRTLALTEELDTPPITEQDVEIVEPLEDCDELGLDNLVGNNVGLLGVIRCIPTREFDSESLSFGLYSSYTITRICLEPLPTLSFQKFSAHPIGLGLSSLTLGSTAYLLNLPTNLTIASMTMAALYFIRGTFEPPWGVCDVSTGLAFSTAALAIQMWLVFMQPPSAMTVPQIRSGGKRLCHHRRCHRLLNSPLSSSAASPSLVDAVFSFRAFDFAIACQRRASPRLHQPSTPPVFLLSATHLLEIHTPTPPIFNIEVVARFNEIVTRP
ncbi:hypothetical protein EZV62_000343 [Acer yangbiense]|uniref:CCHC-type domain-containing protein n=1 Tax=Acer yangbiense TaxID=1000413 RepID=A0A5C7ISG6_9ROSI|nr:hypothetical protein EZV62_000343 [Acer yangbiense]